MKPQRILLLSLLLCLPSLGLFCAPKRPPASSVLLRSKLDKRIVALNVELRDHRLAEVAQAIAMGELRDDRAIKEAMAARAVPYVQWTVYRAGEQEDDEEGIARLLKKLRRLSPARCGMVDKPVETALCARAVIELNTVPVSGNEGGQLRVQGAAQGSARVEEIVILGADGTLQSAPVERDGRAFSSVFEARQGSGLYTVEVLARTGRGIEAAARWWLRVGSARLPEPVSRDPEPEDSKAPQMIQRAFGQLNQDRQAASVGAITWSAVLADLADKRAGEFAKVGALAPPDEEMLAKLRVEGARALTHYSEALASGPSLAWAMAELMQSPSKRRTHLDPDLSSGAVGVARGSDGDVYLIEVMGRPYNPEDPKELRLAIVDRVNLARRRLGVPELQTHEALTRYAAKIAAQCRKKNRFYDKDELSRTLSDAILDDIDGLQFAGSEMFKVSGAEEVTPGTTPTDKRFGLVGVGVSRKKGDSWWVVILVATPEGAQ